MIAAAGPGEAAFEIDGKTPEARHGFFTQRLLAWLAAKAGRGGRSDELAKYLADRVPEDVRPAELAEQTPERRGTEEPVVVGVVQGGAGR